MRHYILVALVAALLALPSSLSAFSLSPSSWFGGDSVSVMGRTHDKSHDVTSNGVTKVQMQYLYKEDWLVTDVDMSTNVVLSVSGKNLSIRDRGTTVWTSTDGMSRSLMTNVVGHVYGNSVLFDVRHGTVVSMRAAGKPLRNVLSVSFDEAGYGEYASECRVLVRSDGDSSLSIIGSAMDRFMGTTSFVLDSGYHLLTLTRLAYDRDSGTYLAYADIHRLD